MSVSDDGHDPADGARVRTKADSAGVPRRAVQVYQSRVQEYQSRVQVYQSRVQVYRHLVFI